MNRFLEQFFSLPNFLLPPDWITIFYLAITGVLICIFRKNLRWWGGYLFTHLAVILGLLSLSFIPEGALPLPLQILRNWYPIATIPLFYWEILPLTQVVYQGYLDDKIVEWEDWLFKGQPSAYLSGRFPSRMLSEFLHLSYFSYYGIVVALAAVLYFQGRQEAFHEAVFAEVLTFNLCLIWFIFMPVTGPRYKFEKIKGHLADGFFFKLVHAILSGASSKGTAFPSSHCAIAVIVVLYAARYDQIAFTVLCPFGTGLVISTVYGRFHYAVDAVAGTVLAGVMFGLAPYLYRLLS